MDQFDFKALRSQVDLYVDKFAKQDQLGNLLGARLISLSNSECIFEYQVNPSHFNPNNILHGGALFSIMDSSQGAFLHYILDESYTSAVTGTATVRYEVPVKSGTVKIRTFLVKRDGRKYYVTSEATLDSKKVARLEEVWIAIP